MSSTPLRDIAAAAVISLSLALIVSIAPTECFFVAWGLVWIIIVLAFLKTLVSRADHRRILAASLIVLLVLGYASATAFDMLELGKRFYPDTQFWESGGRNLLNALRARSAIPGLGAMAAITGSAFFWGFAAFNALHFWIMRDPLLICFSNIGLYGLTCVFVYRLTARLFGRSRAKTAALLLLLNPGGIYWCMFDLHDALSTFLFVAFLLLFYESLASVRVSLLLLLAIALLFQAFVRPYLLAIQCFGVATFAAFRASPVARVALALACLGLLVFADRVAHDAAHWVYGAGLAQQMGSNFALLQSHMESARALVLSKNRWFIGRAGVRSLATLMLLSIGHFLFVPSLFNWKGDGAFLLPGNIFLYWLLPYAIVGLWTMAREYSQKSSVMYVSVIGIFAVVAVSPILSEPRHRTMLLPILGMAGSLGLAKASSITFYLGIAIWSAALLSAAMSSSSL